MFASRNIIRGSFRLSIVAAVLAAVYSVYETTSKHSAAMDEWYKFKYTLECGSRRSEETLKAYVNEFGNVDLSQVGCSESQFWASFEEMRDAAKGKLQPWPIAPAFDGWKTALVGLGVFILVNLLGLAIVAILKVSLWVKEGFKPS